MINNSQPGAQPANKGRNYFMQHTFYVTIKVIVESPLPLDEAMQQFNAETDYQYRDTAEVKVIETAIVQTDIQF